MTSAFYIFSQAPEWFKQQCQDMSQHKERPDYHPEPSVWDHLNIVAYRCSLHNNPNLVLTAWLHDSFKLILTEINPKTGYPTAPGHDKAAAKLVRTNKDIQKWIKNCGGDVECVEWLCAQHMRINSIDEMRPKKRRDLENHKWFPLLQTFHQADDMTTFVDI